jgi:hypothetical protein
MSDGLIIPIMIGWAGLILVVLLLVGIKAWSKKK